MVSGRSAARATWYGLPLSSDSSCARSSACFSIRSASLFINTPRCEALIFRHGLVHIRRVGLRHLRNHFTRRRIDRRERFSRSAVHPFPVDQKFCRANLDIPFHHCRCRSHFELLLRWCSARRWVRSKTPQAPPGASILRERSLYPRTDGGKDVYRIIAAPSSSPG